MVLRSLRRRRVVVVLCCLLAPAAAFALSKSQTKEYTASASLLFRDAGFDQKLFGSQTFQGSQDPAREAATNVKLVSLDVVADRTEKRLPSFGSVKGKVVVKAEGESDVVSIAATDHNPRRAARIANVFAEEYIGFRRKADRAKIAEARDLVKRRLGGLDPSQAQSGQRGSLSDRLEQLDILASLQTGNAELAETAEVPSSPSSPKVVRNTAIGFVLGAVLGVGLALLFERFDRRLRDPKEMEEIFDRPILGAVPESRAFARKDLVRGSLPTQDGEAFRMLRANLRYFNIDHDIESVLVTSAAPGDGKSTVSWNLAVAAAGAGGRALLIEADLRHPVIAESLGIGRARGLSTVLSGEAALDECVQELPVRSSASGRGLRTVDVLLAGPLPPNPADLLESDRMREVISEAEQNYDLVVIDTPPTSVVSDAIPLVKQVGGVIVVGRLGKTTREGATHLKNQLTNLDAPVLGLVVNGIGSDSETYGYGYGYAEGYGIQGGAHTATASVPPE